MPNTSNLPDLVIIGGGIAGSAAALRAAQYQLRVLWIRGSRKDAKRSRGQWVVNIDNMIGVHEGIVRKKIERVFARGDEFEGARSALAKTEHLTISTRDIIRNVTDRIDDEFTGLVTSIDETCTAAKRLDDGTFELTVTDGKGVETTHRAPKVVLATGVMDRQPSILKEHRGEHVDSVKWIYPAANREQILYCIRCEGHLTRDTCAAVIGHGESAAQLAMMLHERYDSMCALITNGEEPEWSERSEKLLKAYGIATYCSRITDFDSARDGLRRIELEDKSTLDVNFALVSLGLFRVYNNLAVSLGADLANEGQPTEERHVLINSKGETSVEGLFAIGDMTSRDDEPVMKQVYTCQEYAVRAVDTIDRARREVMKKAALLAHSLRE